MSAQDLLQYATWGLFVTIFVATAAQAVRHPRRSTIDPALLFGVAVLLAATSVGPVRAALSRYELLSDVAVSTLLVFDYLLLRLAEDFARVPGWFLHAAELALVASIATLFFVAAYPLWIIVMLLAYFVVVTVYATATFLREAALSRGVTRRRVVAIAAGSAFVSANLLVIGAGWVFPAFSAVWASMSAVLGLGAGFAYFVGFATPEWLRRAWQAPELRDFLAAAASLPRMPDSQAILRELERGAALTLGAEGARIGLWDEHRQVLLYDAKHAPLQVAIESSSDEAVVPFQPQELLAGQALLLQRPVVAMDTPKLMQVPGRVYRSRGTRNLLAAPITADGVRIGALTVHARTTVFVEEDLELLGLLAMQAATVLQTRRLIDESTRLEAQQEATRLKDDFLSAAAHDLRSPLTSILGQAQRMQRQVHRDGGQVDPHSIDVIVEQTGRLRTLVNELLDANRVERRALSGLLEVTDVAEILRDLCSRPLSESHQIALEAPAAIAGRFDGPRLRQLFVNLLENAIKYSPAGGDIAVRAETLDGVMNVTVSDPGIGIAPEELPHIFDRFRRGSNVDDRHFPGLGLGLYICRGIVDEHGGRIWATSTPGQGTIMHVSMPLNREGHE